MTELAPKKRGRPFGSTKKKSQEAAQLFGAASEAKSTDFERPSFRPETAKSEDPRTRAAQRAAELRNHLGNLDEGPDEFYFDANLIPDGWSYEWKRQRVLGAEDAAYSVALRRTGWEPVPASRHPEMMPTGATGYIERKGMILMERPKEITDEMRAIDYRNARNQVRTKEQQLAAAPDGQFGRDHAQVKPKISKGYEPMAIPSDK
jgi:hypothetical protein